MEDLERIKTVKMDYGSFSACVNSYFNLMRAINKDEVDACDWGDD